MSYPNIDPKHVYGDDLVMIFGPRAGRKHVSQINPADREVILKKIPQYIDTDDLGPRPSFYQIANKVLSVLQQTQALVGIDLNWCDNLKKGKLERHESMYISTDLAYKNNSVQRGIWLRHLVRDILFDFDPTNVLIGLGRKLTDGTVNLNNGQHRSTGAIIIGVRQIPVEFTTSDLESVDVDQYATDNLNTLASSEFDDFRIRVKRITARRGEGRTDIDPRDQDMEVLFNIHASRNSRFVEKGTLNPNALECTGVGNMIKYFDSYGPDIYARALDINCTVFSKSSVSTANCWGLMEFIHEQYKNGLCKIKDPMFDFKIVQALVTRFSDPSKSGMHHDFKRAFRNGAGNELDIPEKIIIAAGIWKVCSIYNPSIEWEPITWNKKNVADNYLEMFRCILINKEMEAA